MTPSLQYALDTAHMQADGTFRIAYDWTRLSHAVNPQPTIANRVAECGYVLLAFGYHVMESEYYLVFKRKDAT